MNMLIAAGKGQPLYYVHAGSDTPELPVLRRSPNFDSASFVIGFCEYLESKTKQIATAGSPYVAYEKQIIPLEFQATVRVTGERSGSIYLTASRAMLTIMLMRMGSTDITMERMRQALLDIANAMVDAARREGNDELLIWTPSVSTEQNRKIECNGNPRPFVIPIQWRKFTAQLVICLD